MKHKNHQKQGSYMWWSQLINSFRVIWSKRFLKVFIFDLLVIITFITIFSSVTIKIKEAAPSLDKIGPLAQQLIDTVQKTQTEITGENIELIKINANIIKSVSYKFFIIVAKYVIASLLLLSLLIYPFRFFGWSALVYRKVFLKMLGRFYILRTIWASVWIIIILLTIWSFKFPSNTIISLVEILLFLYFGIFLNLIFFNGGTRFKQLVRCFLLGIRIKSLIWLGTVLLIIYSGALISKMLIGINILFVFVALILIALVSPWSKSYLTMIYPFTERTKR
ncbi:MAG: hypothetical protein ABIA62_07655 [Candidatus Woesearchaeota archaeon]